MTKKAEKHKNSPVVLLLMFLINLGAFLTSVSAFALKLPFILLKFLRLKTGASFFLLREIVAILALKHRVFSQNIKLLRSIAPKLSNIKQSLTDMFKKFLKGSQFALNNISIQRILSPLIIRLLSVSKIIREFQRTLKQNMQEKFKFAKKIRSNNVAQTEIRGSLLSALLSKSHSRAKTSSPLGENKKSSNAHKKKSSAKSNSRTKTTYSSTKFAGKNFPFTIKRNLKKNFYFITKFSAPFFVTELINNILMSNNANQQKRKYTRKSYVTHKKIPTKFQAVIKSAKIFSSGIAFSFVFIYVPSVFYSWYRTLPKPELIDQIVVSNRPTVILDRKGRTLYEVYVDKKYDPVKLQKVPRYVVMATLAVEDHEFFSHNGIRPVSIVRAAKATVLDESLQGGSTITQQLVKNVLLTSERTMTRKIKEIFISLAVEKKYTKNEILEFYLNNIPYGGTAWGVESASRKFFGKSVADLTLAEGAFLASLPSAPSTYSPHTGNVEKAVSRQKLVLKRMRELGYITQLEYDDALAQELNFAPNYEYIRAPHFVAYVRDELEKKYGKRMVELGGLTVRTSLDLDLQEDVESIVSKEVANSTHLQITNGAAIVLDPKSGEILAYVGSVDYYKDTWGAYDIITALRQPGSAIKVVTYALALEKGYTAASQIVDAPLTIQLGGGQKYSPVNYDGRFHGTVTLRSALANSYNIPAVKLVVSLSPDGMVTLGKQMGLKNWEVDDSYGYSVTLGGKETRLMDLTNVYATLARGGKYLDTTPFISVKDSRGYEIYKPSVSDSKQIIKPETAYIMSNILSDNKARTPSFGSNSSLNIPNHAVAVKTGTTNDKRDNYTVGYTPSYVVGVWVGNNDNSPMNPFLASGISGAAPIWNRVTSHLLEGVPSEDFAMPEGVFVKIDNKCGIREVFLKGTDPSNLCPAKEDKEKKDKKEVN